MKQVEDIQTFKFNNWLIKFHIRRVREATGGAFSWTDLTLPSIGSEYLRDIAKMSYIKITD